MAVTALITFDQGGAGTPGEAFEGAVSAPVTVTNTVNTGVVSWTITMVDCPSDSTYYPCPNVLGTAVSGTPSAIFTPDNPGSYRIQLELVGSVPTDTDTDIRNFGARNPRGFIFPPFQKFPDPLPLVGSGLPGEKPDESNYSGFVRGWAGSRSGGQLENFFTAYDDLPVKTVSSSPFTASNYWDQPLYNVTAAGTPTFYLPVTGTIRVGQRFRIYVGSAATVLIVMPPSGHNICGKSVWRMLGGTYSEFVYLGGVDWLLLGSKREIYEQSILAGVTSTDSVGFVTVGAISITPANYPNLDSVTWEAIVETTNAYDTAEVRLFNVTTGSQVAGTVLSTASLTPALLTSSITLASGANTYEAQVRLTTDFWKTVTGCTVGSDSIYKTSATPGWNAGGSSMYALSGDGQLDFTVVHVADSVLGGLSHVDSGPSDLTVDFAFKVVAGSWSVLESGTVKASGAGLVDTDSFTINVTSGVVTYLINGSLVYTSLIAPTFPLYFDSSISSVGAYVGMENVFITGGAIVGTHNTATCKQARLLLNWVQP
jgi:hypothetical protein